MAKKGYYYIPQVDYTLNGQQYYSAKIVGDITFDFSANKIIFSISQYFPVGSVFHFHGNCVDYIIKSRQIRWGLWYEAVREDGKKISPEDVDIFNSGRTLYRN